MRERSNSRVTEPLSNPVFFPGPASTPDMALYKNWDEQAGMRGYAAIRTEDPYMIYLFDQTGRFDREECWRQLFSTSDPLIYATLLEEAR